VVTYEALRADPVPGFAAILHWLGRPADRAAEAVAAKSFAAMQARELARPQRRGAPDRRNDEGARKTRQGKVRGYESALRPETIAAAREIAARFGFEA
jgi:hypothetical protein